MFCRPTKIQYERTWGCNADELRVELTKWTSKQTKAELAEKLGGIVPSGAVNNVEDI